MNPLIRFVLTSFIFISCSTNVIVQNASSLKGKKIGVQDFRMSSANLPKKRIAGNDSVCDCIGQSAAEMFIPYLQQSGFKATTLDINAKAHANELLQKADSLQLDYVLVGSGIVEYMGSSTFIRQLTFKIFNPKNYVMEASGSFSGSSVRLPGAVERIGKKLVKQMNK